MVVFHWSETEQMLSVPNWCIFKPNEAGVMLSFDSPSNATGFNHSTVQSNEPRGG